jgi:hypothetical protein
MGFHQGEVVSKVRARFQRIREIGAVVGYFHKTDLAASAAAFAVQAFAFEEYWERLEELETSS